MRLYVSVNSATYKVCCWLILSWFSIHTQVYAQASTYEFTATCQQAYKEITQLKINNGLSLVERAKKENPSNLIPYILESYADFFVLFFNEDKALYQQKQSIINSRIDKLKEGNAKSPFYNFCISVCYLHKAAIQIRFGELFSAGWNAKKAYSYIKDNQAAYPTFTPNKLILGGLQTMLGTVPKSYTWVAGLFGMRGSVTEGMKTVNAFLTQNDVWSRLLNNEATFMYCYLKFYIENKKDETIKYIQSHKLDVVNNHLFTYMAANLAINNKQPEYAKQIILGRNKSPEYLETQVWDYEMGLAKLYHLETQEAITYLERFIKNFKGNYYVKDVYLRIAWAYYLMGNTQQAELNKHNTLTKGKKDSDADKHAYKEAQQASWPNSILLKSRLLNDGGYNKEALQLLLPVKKTFTTEAEKLECSYRLGRIYDDMKEDTLALPYYLEAIQLGENRTEYYAARAALQMAAIYENRKDFKMAIYYYNRCLDMEDHDYKSSLDQRAKSGLARCTGN